ncbi:efflux RND transporter periplasmic adaptor subunit [Candidatus Margulisiibacteriota bacterium]
MKILTAIVIICIIIGGGIWFFTQMRHDHQENLVPVIENGKILYYTCSMHPSVKVTPKEYEKGNTTCPICFMPLIPVREEASSGKQQLKQETLVQITNVQSTLANIHTEKVTKKSLFQEIRTVGEVAYDPQLVSAQEEFVTAIEAYESIAEESKEAKQRAFDLVSATKRKLNILGMSHQEINLLETTKKIDNNLVLPEEYVWVYAHLYDFEKSNVRVGSSVNIISDTKPGMILQGRVTAIESVSNKKTRTTKVRINVKNTHKILQPNMYVDVYIKKNIGTQVAIPKNAVLDTGERKIVYIQKENNYIQKEVKIGHEAMVRVQGEKRKYYPVLKGISAGDYVVTNGNFLIDSQQQISGKASSAFGGALGNGEEVKPPVHQH